MFLGLNQWTWSFVVVGLIVAVSFVRNIRRRGELQWDPRPPTTRERVMAGVWLLVFLVVAANWFAGWRLFGGYDNWVFLGVGLGSLLIIERMPRVTRT